MAWALFGPLIATNATTGERVVGGVGRVYDVADTSYATPLSVRLLSGAVVTEVTSGQDGYLPAFAVEDRAVVVWRSGAAQPVVLNSLLGLDAAMTALRGEVATLAQRGLSPDPTVWATRQFVSETVAGGVSLEDYATKAELNAALAQIGALTTRVTALESGAVQTGWTGEVALIGDSLIEGLGYTFTPGATVGRKVLESGQRPKRYWLCASGHPELKFQPSNVAWSSVTPTYNGVPWSFFLEPGASVRWPLEGNPARVEVWLRRDNGSAMHTGTISGTSASGATGTLSGAQTDTGTTFGIEKITIDNPGAWVEASIAGGGTRSQVLGVRVFVEVGSGGAGLYAMGQSGLASNYLAQQTHQWRTWSNLLKRLGVTRVIHDVMVNDALANVATGTYKTNVETTVSQLNQAGISRITGILMPNLGGKDLAGYRAAAVSSTLTDTIDATGMPTNSANVGGDGVHLTEAGNAALAQIVVAALSP